MHRYLKYIPLLLLTGLVSTLVYAQDTAPVAPTATEAAAEAEAAPAPDAEVAPALTKVAIFPFRSRPKVDTRVAITVTRQLTAVLEEDGRFELLPQAAMTNLETEIEYTRRGNIKVQSAADWGTAHGMDYVIVGSVVAAGKGHGGVGIGGVRISAKAISLGIDIQLVQCDIAEAIIEDTFKEEKTGLGLAVGAVEFDPESRKGSEMVTAVMAQINRAVLTTFHPPTITSVDAATQEIGLVPGLRVFQVGERWEIFSPSGDKINSKTGKSGPAKASKIGALEIVSVTEENALAQLTDGSAQVDATVRFDKAAPTNE